VAGGGVGSTRSVTQEVVIVPYRDGPYLVRGPVAMRDQHGTPFTLTRETIALCRCGRSQTRPFCDGTHRAINFRAPSEIERQPTSGFQGDGPPGGASARRAPTEDHDDRSGRLRFDSGSRPPAVDAALRRAATTAAMIPGDSGRRVRALIAGALALLDCGAPNDDCDASLALIADAIQAMTADGSVRQVHRRRVMAELRAARRDLEAVA
jgi:CDGSH-type Zn-finger protein